MPPNIAPRTAQIINNIPGTLPFDPIATAPMMIDKNAAKPPIHPIATTVVPPSASSAAPTPPINKVAIAAIVPKSPPIKAIIPPDFFIFIFPF